MISFNLAWERLWLNAQGLFNRDSVLVQENEQTAPLISHKDTWYASMQETTEHYKKQLKIINWIGFGYVIYATIAFIVACILLPRIGDLTTGEEVLLYYILPGCMTFTILTFITVTVVRFCILKRTHQINFNVCTLVNITLFIVCFFSGQIISIVMYNQLLEFRDDSQPITIDFYNLQMNTLNNLYLANLIMRLLMYIFLSILLFNMYRSIDQFMPESKTVKIEELVQKYENNDDSAAGGSSDFSFRILGHQRHNSVDRFDQFYKHYMRHLIDEMVREENEPT